MKLQDIIKDVKTRPLDDDIRTALEIGTGKGGTASLMAENGIRTTAIDLVRPEEMHPDVQFETTRFEDYHPEKRFDLVYARNVIPFMDNKPEQLARMLTMGTYVYVTFFGPHDPWATLGRTVKKEDMLRVLETGDILYAKEEEFDGFTMNKDVKHWHIFTYLVKTN